VPTTPNRISRWYTYPKSPKRNAHIERFNRTLQESFVDYHEDLLFTDLHLFNQKLADWLVFSNAQRPHSSLGERPPPVAHPRPTPVPYVLVAFKPLPVQLIHRYKERGVVLRQGYGLTEVGVNCFTMTEQEAWEKAGSIGKPFPFTQARVVDKEGKALGPGEVGELLLAGPHVSAGYFRNPQATAEAFDPEGFFHTGDMVTYDPEGFYYVVGRAKEMFISGGVNVFPGEVEAVLQAHPQVVDVAVVGVPDELWGEHGVAFVVAAGDLSADGLVEFLRPRIASFKIPKEFFFVEALPRTAYGKVVRRALVEQWRRRQGAQKP
jgi:fatty-acyl-CoA synthase